MEEKKIKEILASRLKREINLAFNGRPLSIEYIDGYREAIHNILWDLFKQVLILGEDLKYMSELIKQGKIKIVNINIDKIKENQ